MKARTSIRFVHAQAALASLLLCSSGRAADWPGWRGARRDGHSADTLPSTLDSSPKPLWKKAVGHGYSGPVIVGTKLIFLDDSSGQETARCFETATGKEVWSRPFGESFRDEFEPGPRCTPLVDGDSIFVQSCYGEFACLSLATGTKKWGFNFREYGMFWVKEKGASTGAANRRGNSGAPVIDGDRIIVQVGSPEGASLVAFDKTTGKQLWKSQNDLTTYSSLVTGTLGGRHQAVTATCEGLLGVDVRDGVPLWRVNFKTGANRNVLTPVLDGDTVTFASHTTGLQRLRIEPDGDGVKATEVWFNRDLKINLATPVLVSGHFYGHGPSKNFVCVEASTGTVKWTEPGFDQYASTIASGGRLLILSDAGEAILIAANPGKFEELGRFQACGKTFSHPAFANGVLYTRDSRELAAWPLAPAAR